jgi:Flp pilus assembly protein TadG
VNLCQISRDEGGVSAVEFALTAPIFFALLFGIIEGGLVLWTQLGLQHGAEMAARCATVNAATTCGTVSAIQAFAAQQALGLDPPSSTFAVTTPACGNQVTASHSYQFLTGYFGAPSVTLSAQSCFPK